MNKVFTFIIYFFLSIFCLGVLFKIRSYPGATFFLVFGAILSSCTVVIGLIVRFFSNKPNHKSFPHLLIIAALLFCNMWIIQKYPNYTFLPYLIYPIGLMAIADLLIYKREKKPLLISLFTVGLISSFLILFGQNLLGLNSLKPTVLRPIAHERISVKLNANFNSEQAQLIFNKAKYESKRNNHYNAISLYKNVISIERDNKATYFEISNEYSTIKNFKHAILYADTGLNISPDYAELLSNRGFYKLKNNQFEAGKIDLENALKLQPNNLGAIGNLCYAYYFLGNADRFCQNVVKYESLHPSQNRSYFEIMDFKKELCD